MSNAVGRPPKFESPAEMQKAIDDYFKDEPEYPTQSGLALSIGFADRESLRQYKAKDEFTNTVRRALARIDAIHERNLFENGCSGSIFYLKNRGWSDKQQLEHSIEPEREMPKTIDELYERT